MAQAARLAAETNAELAALFVEDADLLKLAHLPVWEISLATGGARRPDSRAMERELRARAVARPGRAVRRGPAPAPVLALFEPEGDARAALEVLEVARGMAAELDAALSVLATVSTPARARRTRALAETHLNATEARASWRAVRAEASRIMVALARLPTRVVVLDARGPSIRAGLLDELLCAADAEAVLVNRR